MDLAKGYEIRAYVINDNGEIAIYCQACAEREDIRREDTREEPYLSLIEEYEDSIHLVKDFSCESCGGEQEHECGEAKLL
jgi:hypothetical protein